MPLHFLCTKSLPCMPLLPSLVIVMGKLAAIPLPLLVEATTNLFLNLIILFFFIFSTLVGMFAFQPKYVSIPFTTQFDAPLCYVHVLHACVACMRCMRRMRVSKFLPP